MYSVLNECLPKSLAFGYLVRSRLLFEEEWGRGGLAGRSVWLGTGSEDSKDSCHFELLLSVSVCGWKSEPAAAGAVPSLPACYYALYEDVVMGSCVSGIVHPSFCKPLWSQHLIKAIEESLEPC